MPSTIASSARIANSGAWAARAGFATASALYVLVQDTSDAGIEVWKSIDGTTWAQQDAANEPTSFNTTGSYSAWLHTDGFLSVIYNHATGSAARVKRFDTATDTWESGTIGNVNIPNAADVGRSVRVVVRSDGDILVVRYNGTNLHTSRWEGSAWNSDAAFGGNCLPHDAMVDGNDRTWYTFHDDANNDNSYRSQAADNTLGTLTDFDATAHTTDGMRSSIGVLYHDGTNNRLAVMGRDFDGALDLYYGIPSGSTLTGAGITNAVVASLIPQPTSAAVAVADLGSGDRVVIVWAEATTIKYRVSDQLAPAYTFAAEVTVLSGLTDIDPCPQWIRGGGGCGVLYQDNGAVKVEWIVSPSFVSEAVIPLATIPVTGQAPAVAVTVDVPLATLPLATHEPSVAVAVDVPLAVIPVVGIVPAYVSTHDVPLAAVPIVAHTPDIAVAVDIPQAVVALAALDSTVAVSADAPLATIPITGFVPGYVSTHDVPLVSVPVTSFAPSVAVSVDIPSATVPLTAFAPDVSVAADIPLANIPVVAAVPDVAVAVDMPLTSIPVATFDPTTVPSGEETVPLAMMPVVGFAPSVAVSVDVPLATLPIEALAPSVAVSVDVPLTVIPLTAFDPSVSVAVTIPLATAFLVGIVPDVAVGVDVPLVTIPVMTFVPTVIGGPVVITHIFTAPRPLHTFSAAQPALAFSAPRSDHVFVGADRADDFTAGKPIHTFDAPRPGAEEA